MKQKKENSAHFLVVSMDWNQLKEEKMCAKKDDKNK